jgi:hypothetical protein
MIRKPKNHFVPFKGTNRISFGMDRVSIQRLLGNNYRTFLRDESVEITTEYYYEFGILIEYDKNYLCDAIEFTNESSIYFDEENLVVMKYSELRNKFDHLSNQVDVDEFGVIYHDLGFGASIFYDTDKIEAVIIFSKEYHANNNYIFTQE